MVGQRGGLVQLPRPVDGRSYRDVSGADVRGQPQESRTTNANLAGTLSQIAAGQAGKRRRVRRGNWRAYAGLASELLKSPARLRKRNRPSFRGGLASVFRLDQQRFAKA